METNDNSFLEARIEKAVFRLMKVTPSGESARISVPVLYPSGSSAAVEVLFNSGKCFVSDMALGQMEAEMNGAATFYSDAARKASDRFGVDYDGLSIFALWASIDNIESAIASVSNASVFAANNAIIRAVTEKEKRKNEELFEKVSRVFGRNDVVKEQEIIGREAAWPAHNVVSLPNSRKAIFEYVSPNQNSIASKYMMFSDLSKFGDRYSLTSVVGSVEMIGPKGSMLSEVSEIIQLASNDSEFIRRAA